MFVRGDYLYHLKINCWILWNLPFVLFEHLFYLGHPMDNCTITILFCLSKLVLIHCYYKVFGYSFRSISILRSATYKKQGKPKGYT